MAKAFRYALKHSLPILISYIPVALAYGVLMQNCGYNFDEGQPIENMTAVEQE